MSLQVCALICFMAAQIYSLVRTSSGFVCWWTHCVVRTNAFCINRINRSWLQSKSSWQMMFSVTGRKHLKSVVMVFLLDRIHTLEIDRTHNNRATCRKSIQYVNSSNISHALLYFQRSMYVIWKMKGIMWHDGGNNRIHPIKDLCTLPVSKMRFNHHTFLFFFNDKWKTAVYIYSKGTWAQGNEK